MTRARRTGGATAADERKARLARSAKNRAALRHASGEAEVPVYRNADVGTPLAILRGLVEVDTQALVPDDPEQSNGTQRNGTRAQRVWAPDRLSRGRSPAIAQYQYMAASKLYEDYLFAECGARNRPDHSGVFVAAWSRTHYNESRVDARQSFRSAMKAAGPRFRSILTWCVLQETPGPTVAPTVEKWADANGWKSVERAVGFFSGALEVLAVHYGFSDAPGPSERS